MTFKSFVQVEIPDLPLSLAYRMKEFPPEPFWSRARNSTYAVRRRFGLTREAIARFTRGRVAGLFSSDLTTEETSLLFEAFIQAQPKVYLEIGVYWAGTFRKILVLRDLLGLSTRCIGLDVWDELCDPSPNTHESGWPNRLLVDKALRKRQFKNYELLTGLCQQLPEMVHSPIDFAFHDANHTYQAVYDELNCLHPLMTDSAIVAVHNASTEHYPDNMYVKNDGGPYKAVADLIREGKWDMINFRHRLAILKRKTSSQA